MDPLNNLEHARTIINSLQRRADKNWIEALKAKAMVYDLTLRGSMEPLEKELKSQIVGLNRELKKVIASRDKWKKKYYEAIGEECGLEE